MEKKRLRTFVTGFDESLGGGIPEGYVVLISGAPGTMKSSFCSAIAYHSALAKSVKSAYVTLEQSKDLLIEHMHAMGMDDAKAFEHLTILDMGTIRKNLSFLQAKGSWLDLFKMYASNLLPPGGVDGPG